MGKDKTWHRKQRAQRTYMYSPWTRTKAVGNSGGLGGTGWKGDKGGKIGKTVIA